MKYPELTELINQSIKIKEYHKKECRANLDLMSLTDFMMVYGFVSLNFGRQVGHTTYIKNNMCPYSDFVITANTAMSRLISNDVPDNRVFSAQSEPKVGPCRWLWVDSSSLIKRDNIRRWVDQLRPQLIIGLG